MTYFKSLDGMDGWKFINLRISNLKKIIKDLNPKINLNSTYLIKRIRPFNLNLVI